MYERELSLPGNHSFFLFGIRGSGKSTLLKNFISNKKGIYIDLLRADDELKYRRKPDLLIEEVTGAIKSGSPPEFIVIDEVQKIPKILDAVHYLIENEILPGGRKLRFALTGSSARKLKRGGSNLLAGRAFIFNLFPLTFRELHSDFDLDLVLSWGSLPELYSGELKSEKDKSRFLKAYVQTYLKEEILVEQLVRNIEPFYAFLESAAQLNGDILNFSKIGRFAGVSDKSVEKYYSILEDTLLGFHLLAYNRSIRKQQISSSKFYFQDTGLVRALRGQFSPIDRKSTYEYGRLFESYILCEIFRRNRYLETDYKLSYLKTKDGVEIDLIIRKSSNSHICLEIKSGTIQDLSSFNKQLALSREIPGSRFIVLSQNTSPLSNGDITVYPWQTGLDKIFR
jgi:predicted AAA+ superfamily ATPase